MSDYNPFAPPESAGDPASERIVPEQREQRTQRGIGRFSCLLLFFNLAIFFEVISALLINQDADAALPVIFLGFLFVAMWVTALRLINIGRNSLWALSVIVPGLNIWLGLLCISAPEGCLELKQIDTIGKIIVIFCCGLAILRLML